MSEQHYYADVNLPFHVWVRERAGARGYRWVLRNASEMRDAASDAPPAPENPRRRPGSPMQLG